MVKIYALTCIENGKAYIGCTVGNIAKRFREHRSLLNAGKHSEPDLLADWNKYGAKAFFIEIVFEMDADAPVQAKAALEHFAMQRYKAFGLLYNRNEACFRPTNEAIEKGRFGSSERARNRIYSPETRLKLRLAQLGIPKNHGAKISETKKLLGQRPSIEAARLGGIASCKKRYSNK